jgi:phosphatidylserine decarboxylase
VYGSSLINFFYSDKFPSYLHQPIIHKFLSHAVGLWQQSNLSQSSVESFVDKYGINISKFKKKVHEYESLHDFSPRLNKQIDLELF